MDIDIEKLAKAAASGFDLSNFKGDVVGLKIVENEFGIIEEGGIGVQKNYYGVQEEGDVPTEKPKAGQGAPTRYLFPKDSDTKVQDLEVMEAEKERLLRYLTEHKMNKDMLTSADDKLNRVIVCFYKMWQKNGLTPKESTSTPALYRFLINDCGLAASVEQKTMEGAMRKMLAGRPDPDTFYDVKDYF